MAYQLDDIKPGDLIRAAVWQEVYAAIIDMDRRLATLESVVPTGGGVAITLVAPSGPVRVGDTLHLIGRNFGVPTTNSISIDGNNVTVAFISPSNDNQLSFVIPTILSLPTTGKLVTLNLSNPNGFAATTLFLLPGQATVPTGTLFVAMSKPPALPIVGTGVPLLFEFSVTGVSSLDDDFTVTPKIDAGATAVLVNASGAPITPAQIHILAAQPPASVSTKFLVAVTFPGTAATGTVGNLTVGLAANHNLTGFTSGSTPLPLKVGSPPPGAQDNVIITVANVHPPATMTPPAAKVGGLIDVPPGKSAQIDFIVALKAADTYSVTITFDTPTGWSFNVISGSSIPPTSTTPPVSVVLTAGAGAGPTNMNLTITSTTNALITGALPQALTSV